MLEIERLASGDAAKDVEQNDVAELLEADQMGEGAADIAGADQGDLVAGHFCLPNEGWNKASLRRPSLSLPGERSPERRIERRMLLTHPPPSGKIAPPATPPARADVT